MCVCVCVRVCARARVCVCVKCVELVHVYDGNGSLRRRQFRIVAVPKHAPAQHLLVCDHVISISSSSSSSSIIFASSPVN